MTLVQLMGDNEHDKHKRSLLIDLAAPRFSQERLGAFQLPHSVSELNEDQLASLKMVLSGMSHDIECVFVYLCVCLYAVVCGVGQ